MQSTHAVATRTKMMINRANQLSYLVRTGQTDIIRVDSMCVCWLLDFTLLAMPRLSKVPSPVGITHESHTSTSSLTREFSHLGKRSDVVSRSTSRR